MKLKLLQKKSPKSSKPSASVVVSAKSKFELPTWVRNKKFFLALAAAVVLAIVLTVLDMSGVFSPSKQKSTEATKGPLALQDRMIQMSRGNPASQSQAYLSKAKYYLSLGQYQSALTNAQKANQLKTNSLPVIETLGDIYVKMGNIQRGVSYYQQDVTMLLKSKAPASQKEVMTGYYQQKIAQAQAKKTANLQK